VNEQQDQFNSLLERSWQALQAGDRVTARRLSEQALAIDPDREEPWLILAAVASPRASVTYLNQALKINPNCQAARQGLLWATDRLNSGETEAADVPRQVQVLVAGSNAIVRHRQIAPLLLLLLLIGLAAGFLWFRFPVNSFAGSPADAVTPTWVAAIVSTTLFPTIPPPTATQLQIVQPLPAEETPTEAPIQAQSLDAEAIAMATDLALPEMPQIIDTAIPTEEPTKSPAQEPKKKNKKKKTAKVDALPQNISSAGRWIDVDLSEQRTYAYENDQIVRSFVVSTGTWQYPTVTGTYQIYVKYRAADMSGPDYYLPDVPYVMYFYKGYGLHGTYWHSNFGTPMSHGCVNLTTDDAGWLFDFASVGTIVHVHQ